MKILIIDDSPLVRAVLKEYLSETGYQIFEAGTCQEANALFDSERPEVVIKDLFMPDCDAVDSIRRFKSINPSVKIIICSTEASKVEILNGLKAGAQDVVLKPLEKQQVVSVLGRMEVM